MKFSTTSTHNRPIPNRPDVTDMPQDAFDYMIFGAEDDGEPDWEGIVQARREANIMDNAEREVW